MLIDSHCHVQFPEFDADRDAVIKRVLDDGVWMVNVGTNVESSRKAVELARQYKEGVYASVGIHPHDADTEYDFTQIEELAQDPKVVGIGETGPDYFRITNSSFAKASEDKHKLRIKERQKELFLKHIELAQKVGKPLIIHCRNAHNDLLSMLNSYFVLRNSSPKGVMHFFGGVGAWENLDKYLAMGFYISLAGVITFKNYKDAEKVKKIPLDRILIETDAPYASPEPHRGKRNEPSYVKFVAEQLAEIKGVSFGDVERQTSINTQELFSI